MKILLVINKNEREQRCMDLISHWLRIFNPEVEIFQCNVSELDFFERSLRFRPDVIMTYPMTAYGLSNYYYIFKHVLGSAIVTFDTEGAIGYYLTEKYIKSFVGYDQYGSTLVDSAIYWGRFVAEVLGNAFVAEGKLSSTARVKYTGYPEYEAHFSTDASLHGLGLPAEMQCKIDLFDKTKRVMILTGFINAEYSKQDCINAGDQFDVNGGDYAEALKRSLCIVGRDRVRKRKWIAAILNMAREHEDSLFIVKCHPLEIFIHKHKNIDPYAQLRTRSNILLVEDSGIAASQVIRHSGLLVHYGSTVLAESYICEIPSVYVHSTRLYADLSNYTSRQNHDQRDWPSTRIVTIDELPALIREHLGASPLAYDLSGATAQLLEDFFNIREGREYVPTREIAELLLNVGEPQPLDIADPHLLRAINSPLGVRAIRFFLNQTITMVAENKIVDALSCFGSVLNLYAYQNRQEHRGLLAEDISAFSSQLAKAAKQKIQLSQFREAESLLKMHELLTPLAAR